MSRLEESLATIGQKRRKNSTRIARQAELGYEDIDIKTHKFMIEECPKEIQFAVLRLRSDPLTQLAHIFLVFLPRDMIDQMLTDLMVKDPNYWVFRTKPLEHVKVNASKVYQMLAHKIRIQGIQKKPLENTKNSYNHNNNKNYNNSYNTYNNNNNLSDEQIKGLMSWKL